MSFVRLGHAGARKGSMWDERRDATLKKVWGRVSISDLKDRFGCCKNTIVLHAQRLGLPSPYSAALRFG